ncbi:cell division protein SepF [Micromonospora sp. NPDC047074]|uniref:cell division protein SepF n=1 Tax=Micromonospora sp. NPDC047074 TaxID=3154339 RepID=UPI0033C7DEFC
MSIDLGLVLLFVAVVLVLVTYVIVDRRHVARPRTEQIWVACRRDHSSDLEGSIALAVRAHQYEVSASRASGVRLDAALRVAPREFAAAAAEIANLLQSGRVVSIDLSLMERYEAARLVDYCHGLTAMANGWVFRLARSVIVITPGP